MGMTPRTSMIAHDILAAASGVLSVAAGWIAHSNGLSLGWSVSITLMALVYSVFGFAAIREASDGFVSEPIRAGIKGFLVVCVLVALWAVDAREVRVRADVQRILLLVWIVCGMLCIAIFVEVARRLAVTQVEFVDLAKTGALPEWRPMTRFAWDVLMLLSPLLVCAISFDLEIAAWLLDIFSQRDLAALVRSALVK